MIGVRSHGWVDAAGLEAPRPTRVDRALVGLIAEGHGRDQLVLGPTAELRRPRRVGWIARESREDRGSLFMDVTQRTGQVQLIGNVIARLTIDRP